MVGYRYDAWGNCTIVYNMSGYATLNPFRYRGYGDNKFLIDLGVIVWGFIGL